MVLTDIKVIVCVLLAWRISRFFKMRNRAGYEQDRYEGRIWRTYAVTTHMKPGAYAGLCFGRFLATWHRSFLAWFVLLMYVAHLVFGV